MDQKLGVKAMIFAAVQHTTGDKTVLFEMVHGPLLSHVYLTSGQVMHNFLRDVSNTANHRVAYET